MLRVEKQKPEVTNSNKLDLISGLFRDRGRIRTFDRLLRRQMLYPAELRDPISKILALVSLKQNTNLKFQRGKNNH